MNSSFLENVKMYLFSQAVSRYCIVYFEIPHPKKKDFDFQRKLYIKIADIKNLNFLLLFHGLSFDTLEKNIWGHQTNYLSRGPK